MAMQILFQTEFAPQLDLRSYVELYEDKVDQETLRYTQSLISGVTENLTTLDSLIKRASQNWRLERMALVDKCIMRIAIYEFRMGPEKLTPQIAINEALEISKKYSSADAPQFINGILDQIAKFPELTGS
jgi:N utilization substance protein B